ncbi:MAG: choice-of-anchor B family protein [Flavobacteriales bacterium]|nr:choice-of-anchor B family protein [Flavobacteriales bacterium]
MRNPIIAAAMVWSLSAAAQYNIEYVGRLDYQDLRNSNLSNLWGYTDEVGNEYAIVGVNGNPDVPNSGGVSVVALGDGTNPQEVFFYPGPPSIWREVKVWGDHAYVTTEANSGGITIVDLGPLPQSTALNATVWDAPDWSRSHSLFIDENGRLYIHGANRGNGGVIMYDLSNPMNPVEVGEYDQWYCHDSFARGDTLYAAHIYAGFFSIVDVSDPANPVLLGVQTTPDDFTHNVWLDDSGQYIFTTDERTNAYVGAYDIGDPTDIVFKDKLRSDNGSGAVPHNTYWLHGHLVTSYYTFGVTIYDAERPHNLVEVGHYDTSPFTGEGFRGAWGVYPFFPSERLIISDIETGLWVLEPTYRRACWLEGTVRNAANELPVGQATVSIVSTPGTSTTGIDGKYATGHHQAGTYTVTASAPGYLSATITGVSLVEGEVTLLDIHLQPLVSFVLTGTVVDAGTLQPLPDAQVRIKSETYLYETTSNASGVFTLPAVFTDEYEVLGGKWGWRTSCPAPQIIGPATAPLVIALEKGYYDDFEFDFGWTVNSTASAGIWERGVPIGTTFNSQWSNPNVDVGGDCGAQCYVTGNGGGGAGNDDVDDGHTTLTSPAFDATSVFDPQIRFNRWFYNAGGSGAPNDRMEVRLTDGTQTVLLETVTQSSSSWFYRTFRILDHMTPGTAMKLFVFITDDNPGHLVEGGFDIFQLVDLSPVGMGEVTQLEMNLWPNPSADRFEVTLPGAQEATLEVFDALGRAALDPIALRGGRATVPHMLSSGTYLVRVTTAAGAQATQRLQVVR